MNKIFLYLILFTILTTSCREETYDDLSPKEKNAFLFYKNIGDSFTYLKNDTDTVTFTIENKKINYYKTFNTLQHYYVQNISILLYSKTDTNSIIINYFSGNNEHVNYYTIFTDTCYSDFNGCGLCNTKIFVNEIERKIDDTVINNFTYKNVYYLKGKDSISNTKALTNYDYGIIKFWNDTISYILLTHM